MSYQGPPSWQVPPPGGWPQPSQSPAPWQPPAPAPIPSGSIGCRHCGYVAPPRLMSSGGSGPDGCLAVVLLCFGIVPGVLYLLFGGTSAVEHAYCQRCGALHGPWGGSNGCLIVAAVFGVSVVVLGALATILR